MKIAPVRLREQLAKQLKPVYLISGDEPLQIQESVLQVRETALSAGYSERTSLQVARGFNWGEFDLSLNSLSLFAEKKLVELRVGSGKIGQGSKHLLAWADQPPGDVVLVIVGDRFDRSVQSSGWYQALSRLGVAVEAKPVELRAMPEWLAQRVKLAGLQADRSALEALAELVEGNLLAAVQEIEKMALLYGEGAILDHQKILAAVSNSARFDLFDLSRALQQNDALHYLRILAGLKDEGVEPTLILWLLTREIRQVSGPKLRGQNHWLRRAAAIDRTMKGLDPGNVWDQFQDLGRSMCGLPLTV